MKIPNVVKILLRMLRGSDSFHQNCTTPAHLASTGTEAVAPILGSDSVSGVPRLPLIFFGGPHRDTFCFVRSRNVYPSRLLWGSVTAYGVLV